MLWSCTSTKIIVRVPPTSVVTVRKYEISRHIRSLRSFVQYMLKCWWRRLDSNTCVRRKQSTNTEIKAKCQHTLTHAHRAAETRRRHHSISAWLTGARRRKHSLDGPWLRSVWQSAQRHSHSFNTVPLTTAITTFATDRRQLTLGAVQVANPATARSRPLCNECWLPRLHTPTTSRLVCQYISHDAMKQKTPFLVTMLLSYTIFNTLFYKSGIYATANDFEKSFSLKTATYRRWRGFQQLKWFLKVRDNSNDSSVTAY